MVECFGRLTSENVPLLKDAMREACERKGRIVLDLKEVPMMDNSGLGGGDAARFGADAGLQAGSDECEQADFGFVHYDECVVAVRGHGTLWRQVDVNIVVFWSGRRARPRLAGMPIRRQHKNLVTIFASKNRVWICRTHQTNAC